MQKQGIKNYIIPIIAFIAGVVISPLIQRPIEHAIDKYYYKEKITYEVISISQLTTQELQYYANSEGLTSFNLNFDDPILSKYNIIKLKLKNRGIAIQSSLKFHASIGNKFVKIIDIEHKVISPFLKKIAISHSIPNLKLSFRAHEKIEDGYVFSWDNPPGDTDIAGYNLYR